MHFRGSYWQAGHWAAPFWGEPGQGGISTGIFENEGGVRAPSAARMAAVMPRAVVGMSPSAATRNVVHSRPMLSTGPRPARRAGPRGIS